jgi:hypothetical protein
MFIDGIKLGEGSDIQNMTIDSGLDFPLEPSVGELFFNLTDNKLYHYDGTNWLYSVLEAPIDGAEYLRKDGDWSVFVPPAGTDLSSLNAHTFIINYDENNPSVGITYTTAVSDPTATAWCNLVNSGYAVFQFYDATLLATTQLPTTINLMDEPLGTVLATFTITPNSADVGLYEWADNKFYVISFYDMGAGTGTFTVVSVNDNMPVSFQPLNVALTDISTLSTNAETGVLTLNAGALTLDSTGYQPFATSLTDLDTNVTSFVDAVFSCAGGILVADTELWNFSQAILTGDGTPIKTGGVWAMDPSVPLTSATTFTVTDLLGSNLSGTGTYDALEINLSVTGVTAGTFRSVTVDVYGRITAGTNPTTLAGYGITNAYTKTEVDTLLAGLDIRASVRAATTANITLSAPQTIDGISVVAGNRVLVKNQTTASENGIYVVAASAWTRAADANTSAELSSGTYCFVEEGTVNADSGWILITDGTITLDTTALTFTQFNGLGQVTAGTGLTKSGNTISLSSGVVTAGTYNNVTVDTYGRVTVGSNVSYLTANQSITLSGDITGTGSTAITTTLANSGVTAGTYKSVTVDVKGRVTAGTNPTTLAGYGITDAPVINPGSPKDGDIKIAAGPIISIYASAAWRQIWPAVYS